MVELSFTNSNVKVETKFRPFSALRNRLALVSQEKFVIERNKIDLGKSVRGGIKPNGLK